MESINRFKGSIFGLAVGDAVGTTLEFKPKGSFTPINDMMGGGPFNLSAGQWTDDTSMALCMMNSLINKGLNPKDQLDNYVKWYKNGFMSSNGKCFDIGITTKMSLEDYIENGNVISKNNNKNSSGNGSLMRLSPISMYSYKYSEYQCMENAAISSKTTHASQICIDSCKFMAVIIHRLLNGANKREALNINYTFCGEVQKVLQGSYKDNKHIKGTGYAIDTIEAALWGFYSTNDFKTGLLKVVNLGDDADTTGAVYGQIAGAYYGYEGIPTEWINKIAMKEEIESMTETIYTQALNP